MSDTGRDANLIPDDVQDNYAALRAGRGWTWEQMADQFDRDAAPNLAAWARAQAASEAPRGRRRPRPDRTAVPPPPEQLTGPPTPPPAPGVPDWAAQDLGAGDTEDGQPPP